jgi:GNAT superfamily N-acetyltransferase
LVHAPQITTRLGQFTNHQKVLRLLSSNNRSHQNLDWLSLEELLQQYLCHIGIDNKELVGVLSIPSEKTRFAWVRLAASYNRTNSIDIMKLLWDKAKYKLQKQGISCVCALSTNCWSEILLDSWSYNTTNEIVALRRKNKSVPINTHSLAHIRKATYGDLSEIISVDSTSFHAMWRYSSYMLQIALQKAKYATVAVINNSCIGYLLATMDTNVPFVARIAVAPEYQKHGIGRALIVNMLDYYNNGTCPVTEVVTQADNYASISLYKSLDFQLIGQVGHVWTYNFNN